MTTKLEQAARPSQQAVAAMQLALEVLEESYENGLLTGIAGLKTIDTITALQEALAEQAEQEPIDHLGIKHDAQLVETFLRCPMTGNQLYFASDPIQKKGMNYMRLQDGEGNDWTLIARLDEGWDGK